MEAASPYRRGHIEVGGGNTGEHGEGPPRLLDTPPPRPATSGADERQSQPRDAVQPLRSASSTDVHGVGKTVADAPTPHQRLAAPLELASF